MSLRDSSRSPSNSEAEGTGNAPVVAGRKGEVV
jgi:hypothetical protein